MGYTEDVFSALDIQDKLQPLYTSGTVFHTFLGEKLPDWQPADVQAAAFSNHGVVTLPGKSAYIFGCEDGTFKDDNART